MSSTTVHSSSSTVTHIEPMVAYPPSTIDAVGSYTLARRPWRMNVTPFEKVLNHRYAGNGTETDPYIVDWLPGDAEDPQAWSTTFKWSQIVLVSIATLSVALSSSAYAGGVVEIIREFHVSQTLVTGGISLFVVGFAFGPLLWAPLSEVYGRRPMYIISFFFLTLWSGVTAASKNIETILVFRFLAGLFGSSPLSNAGGTISDVLNATQLGVGMAIFAAAPFLGPALGPITGGFLGEQAGWRWVELYLCIFSGVLAVVILFLSAETYAPTLLRQRAARLSTATGKVYRVRADAKEIIKLSKILKANLIRPWKFLIFEPIVTILTVYVAIIYGVLYLNFAAYPIVFTQGRGWSVGIGGLAFLGILVGVLLAVLISIVYVNPQYLKAAKKRGGRATPEDRLPPAIAGGILIVVGLAGFAATDGPNVHWIAPIIFGIPFGTGVVLLFLAVLAYLIDSYTIYAASVLAANSVLRSLFGAAFPLFTPQMYAKLGVHWAAALPGFLALACIPFTVLFYKYGAQIRAKCKYAADAERQMAAIIAARMAQNKPKDVVEEEAVTGIAEKADHPQDPAHPEHQEWKQYRILAERDEVDLADDERMRLQDLHTRFEYARAQLEKGESRQHGQVLKEVA